MRWAILPLSGEMQELKVGGGHAWEAFTVEKSGPAVLWETNPMESKPDRFEGTSA